MKTDPRVESSQTHEALTTRRGFLKGTAATAGLLALGELGRVGTALSQTALPSPDASGIKHIVVVMMENRSFDHYLGWLPNADGRQKGLTYVDRAGVAHKTYGLAPEYQGCGHPDPDHSYEGGRDRVQRRRLRRMAARGRERPIRDRLLHAEGSGRSSARRPNGGRSPIATSPPSWRRRTRTASTSTPRRPIGSPTPSSSARCRRSGIGSRQPASRAATTSATCPFLALWGAKYLPISRGPFFGFLADAAAGTLPHVSFVEPRFLGAEIGHSTDDHPYADIRNGQAFHQQRLSRRDHEPGLVAHAARVQLRRVGRLLRSRAAADGADSRRRDRWPATGTACSGSGCRAWWCRRSRGASTSRASCSTTRRSCA